MDLNQITVPCFDYDVSLAFYTTLGLRLIVDSRPRYARFETPAGSTFSIHEQERAPMTSGIVIYFEVDDVDEKCQELAEKGVVFDSEPTDQNWLWREARLSDPAGNQLCIYHAGDNRRHPPWRVKNSAV